MSDPEEREQPCALEYCSAPATESIGGVPLCESCAVTCTPDDIEDALRRLRRHRREMSGTVPHRYGPDAGRY